MAYRLRTACRNANYVCEISCSSWIFYFNGNAAIERRVITQSS